MPASPAMSRVWPVPVHAWSNQPCTTASSVSRPMRVGQRASLEAPVPVLWRSGPLPRATWAGLLVVPAMRRRALAGRRRLRRPDTCRWPAAAQQSGWASQHLDGNEHSRSIRLGGDVADAHGRQHRHREVDRTDAVERLREICGIRDTHACGNDEARQSGGQDLRCPSELPMRWVRGNESGPRDECRQPM
jgi:hypothetical protein